MQQAAKHTTSTPKVPDMQTLQKINAILQRDSLYQMDPDERELLWDNKYALRKQGNVFYKIVASIPRWDDAANVSEVY